MKKLFLLFILLLTSKLTFADAWDNLTMDQAKAVVAHLEENPYIFDYCDCCDIKGEFASKAYFLKVMDAEIVPCSWDNTFYSVKINAEMIGELKRTKSGLKLNKLYKTSAEAINIIYMNYTWAYNSETKMASPLFDIVQYDTYGSENKPCKATFAYPQENVVMKVFKDEIYLNWYSKNMK